MRPPPHDSNPPSPADPASDAASRRVEAIHAGFSNPPRRFGPLPYWFWNFHLDERELLDQLSAFAKAGCAGAIIYPRHGLRTPYLSDEWMKCVGAAAAGAKALNLEIWIADSENWPGGVGSAVSEAWYMKVNRFNATGESAHTFNVGGELAAALAYPRPEEGHLISLETLIDISTAVSGECVTWTPPDARAWDLLLFSAYRYPHADLLAEGAGERLIASTHSRYEAALGDLHEAGITGFFSDDVALVSVWNIPDPEALPWSPDVRDALSASHDLIPVLLSLAADTPDGLARRQQFWQLIAERYRRCFFKPVQSWLEARRLGWAGHLLFEEPLLSQIAAQADFTGMVREFSRPVVDNLAMRPPGHEQNLTASSAHQAGHTAATESFGGAGWGLTLEARRRCFDGQAARGIDLLIPHGVFYSSAGKRKYENPPGEFLREPFEPLYPLFAGHVRRLSWAMTQGRSTAPVALFYPMRAAWSSLQVTQENPLARAVEDDFGRVARLLEDTHYDYTIIDEEALADAEVTPGRLCTSQGSFPILVLPSCPAISRASWARIMEMFENGGKVLCLGMLPESFEDGPDPGMARELLRLAAVEVDLVRRAYLLRERSAAAGQDVYTFTRKHPSDGRFSAFQAGLSHDPEFALGEVRQILTTYYPPDVECREPNFLFRRRSLGGLDLYWIVSTATSVTDFRVALRSHGAPEAWDTVSGHRKPILQYTWVGSDQTVVTLRLAPGEGILIAVPPEEAPHVDAANFVLESVRTEARGRLIEGYDDAANAAPSTTRLTGPPQAVWRSGRAESTLTAAESAPLPVVSLESGWDFRRMEANVLVLDEWRYRRDERGGGRILMWHRRPHPDWDTLPARQPITWFPELEPIEREITSYVWYQTSFNIQEWSPGAGLWAVIEAVDAPLRLWLDGEEIELDEVSSVAPAPCPSSALKDPGYRWIDLSAFAASGHHHLTLLADYRGVTAPNPTNRQRIPIDLVPAPARLVGDFVVQDRARGRAITSRELASGGSGSWTLHGYPHYSGSCVYSRVAVIPPSFRDARIFLELGEIGGVASVRVNGHEAGVFPWPPFRIDISPHTAAGEPAELEICVRNSRANALIGREDPSGMLAGARLVGYRRVRLEARVESAGSPGMSA